MARNRTSPKEVEVECQHVLKTWLESLLYIMSVCSVSMLRILYVQPDKFPI